jgi:alkanesulfonate monooxygenase SsuD/methylene tetrahydromethanopterin reductase-like flavin-dependent oxidoreductase (luciferase family)
VGNKGKLTVRRGRGRQPDPADDFTASGLPTQGSGRRLEEQLTEMKRIWAGEHRGSAVLAVQHDGDHGDAVWRGGGPDVKARGPHGPAPVLPPGIEPAG